VTRTLPTMSPDRRRLQAKAPSGDGDRGPHRRNLLLLWAGQFVNTAGLMMLVPIMPFYLEQMGTRGTAQTQTWAGVAIATPALALTVVTPLWGRVGDRIGRKWMVVRALFGLALAMVVMAIAATPLLLVLGRLLQGTLGGVVEAAAAFASSVGSDRKRGASLGKSFSATAAGSLVGPIAGGLFVGSGGLPQLMLGIAGIAAVIGVGCAVGLHEPVRPLTSAPGGDASTALQDDRPRAMRVPHAVPLVTAAVAAYFGVYGLIPVFAERLRGITPSTASMWVGVLHSVMWGATLIGSFWWGSRNDTTGRPVRSFALAAGGCAASIAVVAFPLAPAAMIPLRLVQGFCFAALAQSLFMHFGRYAPEENKSSFVGVANSFLLAGQSAGPLLAGPLVAVLPVPATVAIMAGSCGAAALLVIRPARAEKPGATSEGEDLPGTGEWSPWQEETAPLPLVTRAQPNRRAGSHGASKTAISVRPLRAWRIAPSHLHSLAARGATPWDRDAGHGGTSAHEARNVLRAWQRSGALVRDAEPMLYCYEQTGPCGSLRGVLADVHLDSTLLPHQDILPAHADGITRLMRVAEMNLDPVLLGYPGDGRTAARLHQFAHHVPLAEVVTADGQTHRLWPITAGAADIAGELRPTAAFIADGHHRHAAARQLRRERFTAGDGPGPWDYLPSLLVDTSQYRLPLRPVHRVLPRLDPWWALQAAQHGFHVTRLGGNLRDWARVLTQQAARGPAFVAVTPHDAWVLTDPHPRLLADALSRWPAALRGLHLAVLHTALIETVWQTPTTPPHLRYETSTRRAVEQVHDQGGVAVLLTAPSEADLRTAATAGVRLPAKTASFGPAPHPGLVLRTFGEASL
jgi:MFS family permease